MNGKFCSYFPGIQSMENPWKIICGKKSMDFHKYHGFSTRAKIHGFYVIFHAFSTKASKVIVDNFIQKAWKKQGFFPCFFRKIVQYEIILKEAWIFSVLFPQKNGFFPCFFHKIVADNFTKSMAFFHGFPTKAWIFPCFFHKSMDFFL